MALCIKALRSAPGPRRLRPRLERRILGEHHARHGAALLSDRARVASPDKCPWLVKPAGRRGACREW